MTNTDDAAQTAVLTLDKNPSQIITLPPHATQLEDLSSIDPEPSLRSFHLQSSSPKGTLRATGFVAAGDGLYVNTLRILDPALDTSNALYATGLTFIGPNYALAVKNLTAQATNISGRAFLSHLSGSPLAAPQNLTSIHILPGEVASLRLESTPGLSLANVVALELRSSGPPGSIAASLSILYPNAPTLSASVPFRDISTEEQATGGYPWRIDGDYVSHAYITNASEVEKAVVIQLLTPFQPPYVIGRRVLAPGETLTYNVKDLHDGKVPDVLGHVLALNATSGQFVWAVDVTKATGGGLLGRTVMESKSNATLRSYSCFSCTCGYAIGRIAINPSRLNLAVGDTATVTTTGYYQSPCATTQVPPPITINNQWRTYDTSVLQLTGNQAAGAGPGQTQFTASYYSNVVFINQGCSYNYQELTAGGTASVVPRGCPTGMQITRIVTKSLPEVDKTDATYLTGIGILTLMTLTPSSQSFASTTITEAITPIPGSNTCPSSIQQYTDFPTVVPSGSAFHPGSSSAHWEANDYGPVTNSFYDSHRILFNFDVLGVGGVSQCSAKASQVYYCQGKPVATFLLTNVYTHGTLNGKAVTNISTTKQ